MAFELTEYPPRSFCEKYEKFLAPHGELLNPAEVFQNKKLGKNAEETIRKAFKITMKKLIKMRSTCAACNEQDIKDAIVCTKCNIVRYCNEECKASKATSHSKVCHMLFEEGIDQILECLPSPVALGQDMLKGKGASVRSWEDWFIKHTHIRGRVKKSMPKISEWWNLTELPNPGEAALAASLERIISNMFTTVLTIGNSPLWYPHLQHFLKKPEDGGKHREINIHLLGADDPEVSCVEAGLIHVSSRCLGAPLNVTLVAPDLKKHPQTMAWSICKPLQVTPLVRVGAYHGLYHDFWEEYIDTASKSKKRPRPDICICIHPGLHSREMFLLWRPTLELLAEEKISCIMTTYNKAEFDQTVKVMKAVGATILQKGKNALGSLHAKQTPYEPDQIWASNSYIIAIDNSMGLEDDE